jgi:hypothetical protein
LTRKEVALTQVSKTISLPLLLQQKPPATLLQPKQEGFFLSVSTFDLQTITLDFH